MKIPDHVLAHLSACTMEGPLLKIPMKLGRPDYQALNKALLAAGGKWNRFAGGHFFDGDAADAIDPILLTGEVQNKKQDFGQFFTPAKLANQLVELADVRDGHSVLEPSFGKGALIDALLRTGKKIEVRGDEIDPRLYKLTRLAETPGHEKITRWRHGDFLDRPTIAMFDRVVMNPPFARQADIQHVSHAFGFLKPGGKLVAIMAAGVMFRQDSRTVAFRKAVEFTGGKLEMLPDDSFASSGTAVRTCICTMQNGEA